MTPSSEAVKLRQLLSIRKKDDVSIARFREDFERFARLFDIPEGVRLRQERLAGVPVEWVMAPGARPVEEGVVLFFHGGGYVSGSLATHRELASRISTAARRPLVAVDYPLAPEHPFPAAHEAASAVYRYLIEEVVDPGRLALVGDSAGAGLGLATVLAAREGGQPLPAVLGLICPWVDLTLSGASMTTLADEDPVLRPPLLRRILPGFLNGTDPADPRVSPLLGELRGLPPCLIQAGTVEILLDDARRLAERARAAGVEAELQVWEGMVHDWHLFAPMVPEGEAAIRQLCAFVNRHLPESVSTSEE